uniref:Proline rich 4 n=1 Tax=Rhinopithecus roxellana TaxID=61622 RepID=A0A2K6Q767_RHIRO
MLLVLLSVVLLALSSAQSTDNVPAFFQGDRPPRHLQVCCKAGGSTSILPGRQAAKTSPGPDTLVVI